MVGDSYHLRILECEFKLNSTLKINSRGEDYLSLIYYNLILFLIDVRLKYFLINYGKIQQKKEFWNEC